jgi:hypothetical protein
MVVINIPDDMVPLVMLALLSEAERRDAMRRYAQIVNDPELATSQARLVDRIGDLVESVGAV